MLFGRIVLCFVLRLSHYKKTVDINHHYRTRHQGNHTRPHTPQLLCCLNHYNPTDNLETTRLSRPDCICRVSGSYRNLLSPFLSYNSRYQGHKPGYNSPDYILLADMGLLLCSRLKPELSRMGISLRLGLGF